MLPGGAPYALATTTDTTASAQAFDLPMPWNTSPASLSRAQSFNLQTDPTGPFVVSSALQLSVGLIPRVVSTTFENPVEGASFRVGHFNSSLNSSGSPMWPAGTRQRESLTVVGITPSGQTVYPTTNATFVSNDGNGNFGGSLSSSCTTLGCSALFTFDQPIQRIDFTMNPYPPAQMMGGQPSLITYPQILVSDIAGFVIPE